MTTKFVSTTENLDTINYPELRRRIVAVTKADPHYTSLDEVEKHLRLFFPGYFVYRGGSHVSLHSVSGSPRLLLVTEKRPDEAIHAAFARVAAYIATLQREEKLYAAAYAHNVDAHGVDEALSYMTDRTFGLSLQRRHELRRAVLAARLDPKPEPEVDRRCPGCGEVVGNPAAHRDCGQPEEPTIPDEPVFYDDGAIDVEPVDHERNAENEPVAAPEAPETTNTPAPEPLPVVTANIGYGSYGDYGSDWQAAKVEGDKVAAFVKAVNDEQGRSLYTVEEKLKAAFRGWHVERHPGLLKLARGKHYAPAAVFSQALTAAEAGVEPGSYMQVWINQGLREATVLAAIGRRYLLEYEMPAGTTAMLVFTVGVLDGGKNVSYGSCPAYWLQAIVDAGLDWIGNGQGRRMLGGVKAALAAKKAGR